MPTSDPFAIPYVCRKIIKLKPNSILDIGTGFGKYGFLAREYSDIWFKRYNKEDWKTRIDGVEVFRKYITPVHSYIYDNIYIGNVLDLLNAWQGLDKYDLIICSDVLEHFEKEDGKLFLQKIEDQSFNAMIVLPIIPGKQGAVFGNIFESHISKWEESELSAYGKVSKIASNTFLLEIGGD